MIPIRFRTSHMIYSSLDYPPYSNWFAGGEHQTNMHVLAMLKQRRYFWNSFTLFIYVFI